MTLIVTGLAVWLAAMVILYRLGRAAALDDAELRRRTQAEQRALAETAQRREWIQTAGRAGRGHGIGRAR